MDINIFDYGNYRQYLKDYYSESKKAKSYFSYRYFARKAGFTSSNFLYLIIKGERNLTDTYFEKFASAMSLEKDESKYFEILILLNQAKDSEIRKYYSELQSYLKNSKQNLISDDEYFYLSRWFYPVIGKFIQDNSENKKITSKVVRKFLDSKLTIKEAQDALTALESVGIIQKNEDGKYLFNNPVVSPSASSLHEKLFALASNIAIPDNIEKHYSELTKIALSKSEYEKIKKQIDSFKEELLSQVQGSEKSKDDVYHLNIELLSFQK